MNLTDSSQAIGARRTEPGRRPLVGKSKLRRMRTKIGPGRIGFRVPAR
jgi:hypothetical protein